jgi:hypothetical protein
MYILNSLPDSLFTMQNFCHGSRERHVEIARTVSAHFKPNEARPFDPSADWVTFLREAPQSNKVNEYTDVHPPYLPLAGYLLGHTRCPEVSSSHDTSRTQGGIPPTIAFSGDHVKWQHNQKPEPATLWLPNTSQAIMPVLDISVIEKLSRGEITKRIERVNVDYNMQIKTQGIKRVLAEALRVYILLSRGNRRVSLLMVLQQRRQR